MSLERYLAGNKVYRHGSSAPTRGTVDPTGYVDRELRKRMIPQDPSQARSGLAAAAMQRLQGGSGVQRFTQPYQSPGSNVRRSIQPVGGNWGGAANSALTAKMAAVKAEHAAQQQQMQEQLRMKIAARPKVSPVGKVSPSKPKPVAKPTALPWDMDSMQQKIDAGDELGQLRNMLMAARQGTQREYGDTMQEINQQQPEEERGLLNNFGGRGMAFSSGYGMGVGNLQNRFAGMRGSAQQALADRLSEFQNQETQGNATYNKRLVAIQQMLAQKLSGRAGSLGFGPVR